jgi:protein-arginine kinase activator protein McsA
MADQDITELLREWPHEPGRINVRLITGADGRKKMQIRIDMGVLQLELDGRPDGQRPQGFESSLDYQVDRLQRYVREGGSADGFVLTPEECKQLREEAVQYYHRYMGLFVLDDYEGTIRDTKRNLAVLDLCRNHAATESDRTFLEQFRPYIIMMRTRAEATRAIVQNQAKRALEALDRGMEEIRQALEESGAAEEFDEANEVQLLRGMRDALVPKLPTSQRVELEERLKAALDAENYELAAILRDELRMMRE